MQATAIVPVAAPAEAPVVIVGAGPAGMRAAAELLRRDPRMPIVIYGDEPWAPYQRAQLTALVVGETNLAGIDNDLRLPVEHRVVKRFHCRVLSIDRMNQRVHDAAGGVQRYSKLILATGSRPHIPDIAGIDRPGVYTFRNLNDVQQLMARRARSRCTVVLGGGLLGIEAARALLRYRTEVVLVQHEPYLMNRQLDAASAAIVRARLEALGIHVQCNDSVQEVMGREALHAVRLRSGEIISCDTLVVATGIAPNTDLALDAGLAIGRGIRVDDSMRTTDPAIYAIGECAEHRDRISGLLAPGMEQAAVAAHQISMERAATQSDPLPLKGGGLGVGVQPPSLPASSTAASDPHPHSFPLAGGRRRAARALRDLLCSGGGQGVGVQRPSFLDGAWRMRNFSRNSRLRGNQARYESTIAAAYLKVVGVAVFSMGDVNEAENSLDHRAIVYAPAGKPVYRKLVLHRGRLVGAIAIGEWSELRRVQEALLGKRRPMFWQLARFRRDGQLWPDAGQDSVANWPATATVCQCNGITRGALSLAVVEQSCDSVEKLSACTSAGKVCGSCKPLLAQLVGAAAQTEAQPGRIGVLGSVAAALLVLAAFLFLAEIPVADSVQGRWQPQALWLDGFWKQVSGFTLLGLGVIASLLSLRKRWKRFGFGDYPWWRVAHVALGALAVALLLVHTGLRLGNHLNFLLIASFLALTALGTIAGAVVALERVPNRWTRRVRALSGYWHVVLLWPLPALLGFHILKVYYF